MELEQMGEVLAKAMGWEWYVNPYNDSKWWVLPDGTAMLASNWAPWESWPQCGLVIEAMLKAGWRLEIDYSPSCPWVKYSKTENGKYYWETSDLAEGDLCAEICEVAARALEAKATDESWVDDLLFGLLVIVALALITGAILGGTR